MAMIWKGKKILILSPQPWSPMLISKHHYAIELARSGASVYFLNPPTARLRPGQVLIAGRPAAGVVVLDYRPIFPMRWKFKFNRFFNSLMKWQVKRFREVLQGRPDVVWDFEPNRQFADLRWFGAPLKIYHPVDATPLMNSSTKHADVIFSVSQVILDYFSDADVPKVFINHGLGESFRELGARQLKTLEQGSTRHAGPLQFGYVGNLLMRYINHELFLRSIEEHAEVRFHIWGPFDTSNLAFPEPDRSKVESFIETLKAKPNVIMYGMRAQADIIPVLPSLDGFFWCYDSQRDPNKGSNSHKLLEYMSTGKVIVSTYVSTYRQAPEDVIVMAESNDVFLTNFKRIIERIEDFNSTELARKRIQIALQNTYPSQLDKISAAIQKLPGKADRSVLESSAPPFHDPGSRVNMNK